MDQYKNEYLSLINDDEDFAAIWQDTEEDFKEWCSDNDIDLVFITTIRDYKVGKMSI